MNLLHVHSVYSLFDAVQTPDDICRKAKEMGVSSVTLTDHGTLLGIDDFMEAGEKYGVNAVPGVEAYCEGKAHLVLVAKNYRGFQAISAAMKEANTRIEKVGSRLTYPIMGDDILERHFKGNTDVFATSACIQGAAGRILLSNRRLEEKAAKAEAARDAYKEKSEAFLAAGQKVQELDAACRARKKQRTAEAKYLKPAYLEKIRKLEEKLAGMDEGHKQYLKTKTALESAKALHDAAERDRPWHDAAVAGLTAELKEARAVKNSLKPASDHFKKGEARVKDIRTGLKPEEELYAEAKGKLLFYKSIFPEFYAELQYHGLEEEAYVMPRILALADETGIPVIAANDAHMADNTPESIEARRIMRFNYFEKTEETSPSDRELYLKGGAELSSALAQILPRERVAEALGNTAVLDTCRVIFPKGEHYPKVEGGISMDSLLAEAIRKKQSEGSWTDEYQERLEHEVSVIQSMGFVDYHLVVRDYCNAGRILGVVPKNRRSEIPDDFEAAKAWIRAEGFRDGVGIGPGRGSAAGSLVCYLLGITNIDPVRYGLLFERFLNPERVSMPDIDTDVATSLRGTVIRYLVSRYGAGAVSSIATVTTYGAKGALQMAGRERANQYFRNIPDKDRREYVSRYQKEITFMLSDAIPEKPDAKLADYEKQLMPLICSNRETQVVWKRARIIEGKVCGTGVHAGGVIIADNGDVNQYVPQAWNEKKSVWVAQCDMVRAEAKGLLKMDLLGLQTLDIITDCLQLVGTYDAVHLDMDKIPFEPEVFADIYAKGNTNSVFQFESDGMKAMLREFKPTCFEDLILLVAAYRPGPMQYLGDIIEVKNGRKKVSYKHPMLESILSTTYGAVIYQEQVMQIFQKLAGYSLGGADLVRRAMSKKKMDKLAHERDAFIHGDPERGIDGCVERGISEKVADSLFDEMMDFARYAFNKSHAAAYALVSYQTAYLKYHYPAEFACAMFNNKDLDAFAPVLDDCTRAGIRILPPDINASSFDFTLEGPKADRHAPRVNFSVRYGIGGIKGIGSENRAMVDAIESERSRHGWFASIHDFLLRTAKAEEKDGKFKYSLFPQAIFRKFVESGLFDFTGLNREAAASAFDDAYKAAGKMKAREDAELAVSHVRVENLDPDIGYNCAREAENLGTLLSFRPLDGYKKADYYGCVETSEISAHEGGRISIFGILAGYKELTTRKGAPMLRLDIHGRCGAVPVLVFEPACSRYLEFVKGSLYQVLRISGRVSRGGLCATQVTRMVKIMRRMSIPELSREECEFISGLGKDAVNRDDNPVRVAVMSWQRPSGGICTKPVEYRFTKAAVKACVDHGIRFGDINLGAQ